MNEKEKKQSRKINLQIGLGLLVLVALIGGVTFAFFNYTRTGSANLLRLGNIEFNSTSTTITLENAFPVSSNPLDLTDTDNVKSLTINITGKNTYVDGMEYLVSIDGNIANLTVGSGANERTIPVSIMVSVLNETNEVKPLGNNDDRYFTNRGGNSNIYKVLAQETLEGNDSLLVGYIAPNQSELNGTIRVTAYFDKEKIAISDTYYNEGETPSDWARDRIILTTSEWNNLRTTNPISFKIKVEANEGTWVENTEPTDASCFTTNTYTNYVYNNNMTNEEKNTCVNMLTEWNNDEYFTEEFCNGTNPFYKFDFEYQFDSTQLQTLVENHIIINNGPAVEITDYDAISCGTDVVIPKEINNLNVTKIANGSFREKGLSSVKIPNTVVVIGNESFYDNQLSSISIPSSVSLIDAYAFARNYLTSVTIPDGVILIRYRAFAYNSITDVVIPSSVELMDKGDDYNVFEGNPLKNVYIDMVNVEGSNIFMTYEENRIETFVLGPHVRTIGERAFSSSNLTGSLVIPNGVTTIGDEAFKYNSLTSVTIPSSVTEWSCDAFDDDVTITNQSSYACT